MSKLDELIQEHCPNGVEMVKIKDYFIRIKGTPITASKMKEISDPNGEIKIFAGGKTIINAKLENIQNANITTVASVLVQSRGVIDFIYYDKPFTFKNEMWAYTDKNPVSVKYLYYVLKNNVAHFKQAASVTGSLPQISLPVTEEFQIPLPPLPVQEEIVRILDLFSAYTAELSAELSAELLLRKKQYQYYRDHLLTFDLGLGGGVKIVKLADVATIKARIGWQGLTKKEYLTQGDYYLITGTDFCNGIIDFNTCHYVEEERFLQDKNIQVKNDDVLVTKDGTLGKVAYVTGLEKPATLNSGIFLIRTKDSEISLNRYLFHYLKSPYLMNFARGKLTGGTIQHLNQNVIVELPIPLPPLAVQERIVEVLDNFETVCNDLNIGLPAEIEARKKQYEFYRDGLLHYATTGHIISSTQHSALSTQHSALSTQHSALSTLNKNLTILIKWTFGCQDSNQTTLSKKIDNVNVTKQVNLYDANEVAFNSKDFYTSDAIKWLKLSECVKTVSNIKWSEHTGEVYQYIDLSSVDVGNHTVKSTELIDWKTAPNRAQQIVYKHDVLFGTTRPMLKRVSLIMEQETQQICSTGFCVLRAKEELVLAKWIYYHISTTGFYEYVKKHQQGASYPAITDLLVKAFKIPVPPIEEQARIVGILDRFDRLCNDMSAGLPAEIEMRQKQYEHYRNRLLTFAVDD